jgi:MoaA/NifB/PqqE/SkfB family radical SAM enzyme
MQTNIDNNYCPRIHHGLSLSKISDNSISYAACCWAKHQTTASNINFEHPDLVKLRTANQLNTLPIGHCVDCIVQENANKQSMRQGYLQTHKELTFQPSLQYLDINIDYTCNLACVTCGPEASTTWRNELKLKGSQIRPNIDSWIESKIKILDLKHLKEVRLWGGEPFLTNTHKKILEFVVGLGIASNVRLMYNTNGTQRIDADTKKLIEQFKFARISFSIDDIGPGFEYLRYPAKWNQVESNLMWWKNNLPHNSMLSITTVASVLNVLYLDRVFEWHNKNFDKSCFGDDIEIYVHQAFGNYGLEALPQSMIEKLQNIQNYCQPWIQRLSTLGTRHNQLNNVRLTLQQNDRRRNLYLDDVYPEVAQLIDYQK